MMEAKKYCIYTRVSTDKQGVSGLGLESQLQHIRKYIASVGGEIVETYIEVESGTSKKTKTTIDKPLTIQQLFRKRPKLIEAAKLCNSNGCILIAYDIERLGRSTFLISYLQQIGIEFVCSAYPNDAPMILNIRATIGQEEAYKKGVNTKKAIRVKIDAGFKWGPKGKFNLTEEARQRSIENRVQAAKEDTNNLQVRSIIKQLHKEGKQPTEIATKLNSLHYRTASGKPFQPHSIYYHLNKINEYRL